MPTINKNWYEISNVAEIDSPAIERCAADAGTPIKAIGRIAEQPQTGETPVSVVTTDGRLVNLASAGWRHF